MFPLSLSLMLIACVTALPPPVKRSDVNSGSNTDDDIFMPDFSAGLTRRRRANIPANFQRLYVFIDGRIDSYTNNEALTVEVYGSPLTSKRGMNIAATIVSRMTRNMPPNIFKRLASSGAGAGVFTKSEKVTIYPNYARYKNTRKCGRSCKGNCAITCTGDGRKYESLAGLGGIIGAIMEDNLLCTPRDPYNHKESILIHEFSHTIKTYGLTWEMKRQVDTAYRAAKNNKTWGSGYAMSTSQEYWAESSQVFMGANQLSAWNAANMNLCHGRGGPFCKNEEEGRERLRLKDPKLYDVLVKTWTNGRPHLAMQTFICPAK